MRFDHLAREFRRRSAALPPGLRTAAIEESLAALSGAARSDQRREVVGRMIGALADVFREAQRDDGILDCLTPETICRLDHMVNSLQEVGWTGFMLERGLSDVCSDPATH